MRSIATEAFEVSQKIGETWRKPSDVMTILLVIGADVVSQTAAQLSGHWFTPIAFSFGWVAYSFNTLMSIAGNGRLMPPPDYDAKIINAENGYIRDNHSWILGRLLRDFERPLGRDIALSVTIFRATGTPKKAGVSDRDWWWFSGVVVIILQLAVAAIPCGLYGDWSILVITFLGTTLALLTGALPQWRFEKWNCRRDTSKGICITRGNGARTVMVIFGCKVGLDLEDLAAAESPRLLRSDKEEPTYTKDMMGLPFVVWITNVSCVVLSVSWIVLLVTVTGLEENNWFLLLIGGMGMLQNVLVAGARRSPSSRGIHLEHVEEFKGKKAMYTLMDLEYAYPKVGRSLLAEFFPNDIRKDEKDWWDGKPSDYDLKRKEDSAERELIEQRSKDPEEKAKKMREEWRKKLKLV